MKILYAVQATGNGHIMRAKENIPMLKKIADVDILISGDLSEISLDGFDVKYKFKGLSFMYDNKGGLSYFKTFFNLKLLQFYKDIKGLDLSSYDFVVSDFEPVSAWACKIQKKTCIISSNQFSFMSDKVPRPKIKNFAAEAIFKHFAPSNKGIGFHYKSYDDFILEPKIRKELANVKVENQGFYVVYLSSYNKKRIFNVLSKFPDKKFYVFSKEVKFEYKHKNVYFSPIDKLDFTNKLIRSEGIITSAGFETTSEGLYLGKKMLVIPIQGQYEQKCNSIALSKDFGDNCIISKELTMKSVSNLLHLKMPEKGIKFNSDYSYTEKILKLVSAE